MVEKRRLDEDGKNGYFWCVIHGHPDTGGERDAPKGTPIKCYRYNPDDPASEAAARKKAEAQHAAIKFSQQRQLGG
jgi:hypothetical protein